jgi:AraC-like DNA-binding protein
MAVAPGNPRDFELWRWTVSPLYDMDALTADARAEFGLTSSGYCYDEMPVSTCQAAGMHLVRDGKVIARTGIDTIGLTLYNNNGQVLETEGPRRTLRAGDIVAIDHARRSTLISDQMTTVNVTLPRGLLTPLLAKPDRMHGAVLPSGTPLNALLAGHMRGLITAGPHVDVTTGAAMARATASLVAVCFGSAVDAREQSAASLQAALLSRIRHHIDEYLPDPQLNADTLISRFHLSRAKLYRLFAPLGGVSSYIRERRLMRIHQAIMNPARFGETLSGLAELAGFSDRTVFSRAYRASFGMSPAEARALARDSFRDAGQSAPAGGSFLEVNKWLHGIHAVP